MWWSKHSLQSFLISLTTRFATKMTFELCLVPGQHHHSIIRIPSYIHNVIPVCSVLEVMRHWLIKYCWIWLGILYCLVFSGCNTALICQIWTSALSLPSKATLFDSCIAFSCSQNRWHPSILTGSSSMTRFGLRNLAFLPTGKTQLSARLSSTTHEPFSSFSCFTLLQRKKFTRILCVPSKCNQTEQIFALVIFYQRTFLLRERENNSIPLPFVIL